MKSLLCFLMFSFSISIVLGQTALEYHLKEGDVFRIKQQAEQIISQELDGAVHEITNTISGILEFKVLGESEDTYEINLSFNDLNLNMVSSIQGPLMAVKAKEVVEGDPQSKVFNTILNNPVKITLAKTGDILEVTGGDSLVAKMAKASGLEDDFSLNMMKKSLEKEFGSKALSNNYKQMTFIYPNTPIKVGESWKNEYSGKLVAKNHWTLDSLNTVHASISGTADIIMNVEEAATTMTLNGTQKTNITTDIATGFITIMKVISTSEGFSTVTQLGDQQIPTVIKSTTTYELIKE